MCRVLQCVRQAGTETVAALCAVSAAMDRVRSPAVTVTASCGGHRRAVFTL